MLYALLPALLAAAFAAGWAAASWRYLTKRRALIRERAAARLCQGAAARDIAALEQILQQAAANEAVLTEAEAVIDSAELLYHRLSPERQHPKGGSDAA